MTNNPPICKIAILRLSCGGRVCRTLRPNDPIKGSGLQVRERRCRYRLGKTRAGLRLQTPLFRNAARRSSLSCNDIGSASMRLNSVSKPSRRPCRPDAAGGGRLLPSHFFDRVNAERKPRQLKLVLGDERNCSISTIRSYIRVWTLDYWRGSARRPIGSATVSDLWTSPVRVGRRLQPAPDPGINCAAGRVAPGRDDPDLAQFTP
jgi:hypothetical protein